MVCRNNSSGHHVMERSARAPRLLAHDLLINITPEDVSTSLKFRKKDVEVAESCCLENGRYIINVRRWRRHAVS